MSTDDLDDMNSFGFNVVRIPVGWWMFDYDVNDGFVDGSK